MKIKLSALTNLLYLESLTEKNSPFISNQYTRLTYNHDVANLTWTINTSSYQVCVITKAADITEPHTESFDIGLDSVKLFAVIKALKGEEVSLTFDENNNVKIKCGRTSVKMQTIVGVELVEPITINQQAWSAALPFNMRIFKDIAKLPSFTTVDTTVFSGIMLGFKDNLFELYSSNRTTIYHVLNEATNAVAGETTILPKSFVTAITKLNISDSATIKVGKLSDTGLYVVAWNDPTNGKGYISSRKLEFPAPNIARALTMDYGHTFTISRDELLNSVKLYEVVTELGTLSLEISSDTLTINHDLLNRQHTITPTNELPSDFSPFKITLGVKDVLTIINTLDEPLITFTTSATSAAVKFIEGNKTIVQAKMRRF